MSPPTARLHNESRSDDACARSIKPLQPVQIIHLEPPFFMYKIIGADQREYGPVSSDQIRAWIREGRLHAQSSVKSEGTESWRMLSEFAEFAADLAFKAPPGLPPLSTEPPKVSQMQAEALASEILARDYDLNIGNCLSRGWNLVMSDFWPIVGVTALIMVILMVTNAIYLGILLNGPLVGGLFVFFLKRIRGTRSTLNDAFAGFTTSFAQLLLGSLVSTILLAIGLFCCVLPFIYLAVAWKFTFLLIADKKIEFWPAMELSRRVVSRHWWVFFGLAIVLALVNLLGTLALCVGVFITTPVTFAAMAYAYEDIFGSRPAPTA